MDSNWDDLTLTCASDADYADHLLGEIMELRQALQDLVDLQVHPDREGVMDAFERVAAKFHKETGVIRPGSTATPDRFTPESWDELNLRRETFNTWYNDAIRRACRVLEETA